jgi:hypothetical protein
MSVQSMKVAAAVAVLALSAAGYAEDSDQANPDTKALLEYVKKLESRVNQLEQEKQWPLDQVRGQSESALEAAVHSINLSGWMEFQYGYNLRHGGTHFAGTGSSVGSGGGGGEGQPKSVSSSGERGDTLVYDPLRGPANDDNGFSFQNVAILAEKPLSAMNSTGFRVLANFGEVSKFLNRDGSFSTNANAFDVREAYMSWRMETKWGMTNYVDLSIGKMASPIGLESPDNMNNWLVTRDPFFVILQPATHTGVRAVFPWEACCKTSVYVVNGWDNVRDSGDGKTLILSQELGKYDVMNSTLTFNASYGNEGSVYSGVVSASGARPSVAPDGNKNWLLEMIWRGEVDKDTHLALDAVWDKQKNGASSPAGSADDSEYHGLNAQVRHQWSKDMWVGGRLGYHSDSGFFAPGIQRALRGYDMSLAVGWDVDKDMTLAVEYRHDHATSDTTPFFSSSGNAAANQDTVTASAVYRF